MAIPPILRTFVPLRILRRGIDLCNRPDLKAQDMISGTVKFYNTTKGFGFIAPDDGGKDAFVQAGAVERAGVSSLGEGQKIYYDIDNGRDRRMAAINLRLP